MDKCEIYFDKILGTATRIESTAWTSKWRIDVADKFLGIEERYNNAKRYKLVDKCIDVDLKKAKEQMPIIMWQIYQLIINAAPKPPKRYR